MKNILRNMAAMMFLVLFLPYTATLLINGRQGIRQEEPLPALEYQVLCRMLQEDYSWMEDEGLKLMAVIFRTDAYVDSEHGSEELSSDFCGPEYERAFQAVKDTKGQVVAIDGECRELPYHAVSAGTTRDGRLLGDEYAYVSSVECPLDLESESYLQICRLTKAELQEALGQDVAIEGLRLERDQAGYVTHAACGKHTWQGEALRTLLHLPSSCFQIDKAGSDLRMTVRGSGHGFGISLYTANRMAKESADFQDIIQKFYQGAECITIP